MADLVETVARIVDPSKWAVLDSYLADMLRKYKGEHIGYDPEPFKDKASMAKAQAAIAAVFDALETPSEGMINCGAGAVIKLPKRSFADPRITALQAENEKLREALLAHKEVAKDYAADALRLREALEYIAETSDDQHISRKALETLEPKP